MMTRLFANQCLHRGPNHPRLIVVTGTVILATLIACGDDKGEPDDSGLGTGSESTHDTHDSHEAGSGSDATGSEATTTTSASTSWSTDNGSTTGAEGDHSTTMASTSDDAGAEGTTDDDTGGNDARVIEVYAAKNHTCALWSDGRAKCWGKNQLGQLGMGHVDSVGTSPDHLGAALPWLDIGDGLTIQSLALSNHICAIDSERNLKCWGHNMDGQLGQGHHDSIGVEPGQMGDQLPYTAVGGGGPDTPVARVISLETGGAHNCVALDTGRVKCWGKNSRGQLGQGHTEYLGDDREEMGDFLPAVDLGVDHEVDRVIDVAAGDQHSCALLQSGNIKCWGYNHRGQLGLEHTRIVGTEEDDMGDDLERVPLTHHRTPIAITAGDNHTCVLFHDETAMCFGDNERGQCGQGHDEAIGDYIGELSAGIASIKFGTDAGVAQLEAAGERTCARFNDGQVKCIGRNFHGAHGVGHEDSIGTDPSHLDDKLYPLQLGGNGRALHIAVSESHTCAVLEEGEVKCWGFNLTGQLGQGHTETIGDEPGEMGNELESSQLE